MSSVALSSSRMYIKTHSAALDTPFMLIPRGINSKTHGRETKTGLRGPRRFSPLLEFALSRTRLIDGRPCPSAGDHLRAARRVVLRERARGGRTMRRRPIDAQTSLVHSLERNLVSGARVHAHSKFRSSSPHRDKAHNTNAVYAAQSCVRTNLI